MNKQLIKLLVLGLGFATVGNTMLAEEKKEETKKENLKKDEKKSEEKTQTWKEYFGSYYKKEEPKKNEDGKTWFQKNIYDSSASEVKPETKKVETKTCFCTRNKTALIWTGSVVVGLGLATAAVLYFDLLGLNDQEEETEEAV